MKNLETLATLAAALPDTHKAAAVELVEKMGEVIEGFGDKPLEWRPELLKLVQGTSDRGKLPKGANIGSFVLGEDIMETPMRTIPIRLWTSRQYWNPDPEQAQMLCSSPDGQVGFQYGECKSCPYSKFDEENKRSQCSKTLSVLSITADLKRIFVTNFSKTNYMSGMDWQGLMKKAGVAPHKRIYTLASVTSTKSKNVELIKAEPIAGNNKVEGPLLDFVNELSRVSGEDRKASLESFYEYVANKKARGQDAALEAPADVVLLSAADEVTDVTPNQEIATDVVENADAKPAKGSKAPKQYAL